MSESCKTCVLIRKGNLDGAQKTLCSFDVSPARFAELRESFRCLTPGQRPPLQTINKMDFVGALSNEWIQFIHWAKGQGVDCHPIANVCLVAYGPQPDISEQLKKLQEHPADVTIRVSCQGECDPV